MRLSSSRLQVVSCIPRCVPVQTSAIWRGEFRRLGILQCNQTFRGLFYGCRRCGFLCCRCDTFWSEQGQCLAVCGMISTDSGKSVETSPGFGSQGVPRTLCSNLWSYRCSSGTRLTDCTTKVPVSSMTMRSVVFTRTPTNTPRDHLDSNLCRVRFR